MEAMNKVIQLENTQYSIQLQKQTLESQKTSLEKTNRMLSNQLEEKSSELLNFKKEKVFFFL